MSSKKRLPGRPAKYPPEFQRGAVAMVLDEGRSIADVARAIGVIEGTLGNWVAKTRRERSAGTGVTVDERAENTTLRAENAWSGRRAVWPPSTAKDPHLPITAIDTETVGAGTTFRPCPPAPAGPETARSTAQANGQPALADATTPAAARVHSVRRVH